MRRTLPRDASTPRIVATIPAAPLPITSALRIGDARFSRTAAMSCLGRLTPMPVAS